MRFLYAQNTSRERVLVEVRQLVEEVIARPLPQPVCRDPDDDEVLALAVTAQADLIVSGDNDLLALSNYAGIPIVSQARAVTMVIG